MKNVLVTGLNGRLAPKLKLALNNTGIEVIPFNREQIDISDLEQQQSYLLDNNIDTVFHLATGPEQWVTALGELTAKHDISFVFTSTESVFNPASTGPFLPSQTADAISDYGQYKILCEKHALQANPKALIVRLGWQMFDSFMEDNLLLHVEKFVDNQNRIYASNQWIPAVAHINDTTNVLIELAKSGVTGIYHLDGNASNISFFDLVTLINKKYNKGWEVIPSSDPSRNGRITDSRLTPTSIEHHLKND